MSRMEVWNPNFGNGQWRRVRSDSKNPYPIVIAPEHSAVHSGIHYVLLGSVDLGAGAYYDIRFTTPNNDKEQHWGFRLVLEDEKTVQLFENVTLTTAHSGATALTPINNNRRSTSTSEMTWSGIANANEGNANGDTAVAAATTLINSVMGIDGGFFSNTAIDAASGEEIILKANEDYSLRFIGTQAGRINYRFSWYEYIPDVED